MISPIILALDTDSLDTAKRWIEATRESVDIYKLGLEFYLSFGAQGISEISRESGVDIFLDLKLHDIPKTVAGATKAVVALQPKFLTVHASGGTAMIEAAAKAAPDIDITAVTILTSLSEDDLFRIGFAHPALESAVALAELSTSAGAKAIVCSPLEISAIRGALGDAVTIITPGVRPVGGRSSDAPSHDDQKRTMTPKGAIDAGANFVVVGRPITEAWNEGQSAMREVAKKIREDISL